MTETVKSVDNPLTDNEKAYLDGVIAPILKYYPELVEHEQHSSGYWFRYEEELLTAVLNEAFGVRYNEYEWQSFLATMVDVVAPDGSAVRKDIDALMPLYRTVYLQAKSKKASYDARIAAHIATLEQEVSRLKALQADMNAAQKPLGVAKA